MGGRLINNAVFLILCGLAWLLQIQLAHSMPLGPLVAVSEIRLGHGGIVDSFDSSDPTHSNWHTNWGYGTYTNALRKGNATVATMDIIHLLNDYEIYGYLAIGPNGIYDYTQPNWSVGNSTWVDTSNFGVQPGHSASNLILTLPDIVLPTPTNAFQTNWLPVPVPPGGSTNINGVTYNLWITNSAANKTNLVFYSLNTLSSSLFVDASNVVLYLTNGWNYGSFSKLLTINSSTNRNGSIKIYSGGSILVRSSINNLTERALNCVIYGLTNCLSIDFYGKVIADVYAPEANLSFFGVGSAENTDTIGSFFCHDIRITSGYMNFHFDEASAFNLPIPPLIFSQPASQAAQLGSNATFTISQAGYLPLKYNWFFNQSNLVGSSVSDASLSLTNVQFSNAGNYSVVVANEYGSATSSPAILFVYTNTTQLAGQLDLPANFTNGQLQFTATGVTGLNYAIQASINLADWTSVTTNTAPFTFSEINSSNFPQRFYRAVFLP